jgi:hypothetical protein
MLLRLLPATFLIATLSGSLLVEQQSAAGAAPPTGGAKGERSALASAKSQSPVVAGKVSALDLDPAQRTTRAPYPKRPTADIRMPINHVTGEDSTTGRLVLKLRDDLGARTGRKAAADRVISFVGKDLGGLNEVLARYGRDDSAARHEQDRRGTSLDRAQGGGEQQARPTRPRQPHGGRGSAGPDGGSRSGAE